MRHVLSSLGYLKIIYTSVATIAKLVLKMQKKVISQIEIEI